LFKTTAIILFVTVVLFFAIEGCASFVVVGGHLVRAPGPLPEEVHTTHDPDLGWVSLPNRKLTDFYGPGKHLTTNSFGFRGAHEPTAQVPGGKVRVICSGDSFTLGHGVSDDEGWCPLLSRLEPRIESVNMGQSGYGVDQAYLWYVREGLGFEHDAHVFAFIANDFDRMRSDKYGGFAKPRLALRDGKIIATNTPVSRLGHRFPWMARNAPLFASLRTLQLLVGGGRAGPSEEETRALALAIFEQLARIHRAKRRELLLVFLPAENDPRDDNALPWRRFLHDELGKRGIAYLDLVEEVKKLSPDEAAALFAGHYSVAGNEWVARKIAGALGALRVRRPWRRHLYANADFEGQSTVSWHDAPRLDWEPRPTQYSVRWEACLELEQAASLPLGLASDDGSRLFIDDKQVIDNWGSHKAVAMKRLARLEPGKHRVTIDYVQYGGMDHLALEADLQKWLVACP
jgi:hypothetical protein